jgi:anaerobic selenocysteine-containing dehydrogenase
VDDIAAAGLQAGQRVTLLSDAADGIERRVTGLEVVAYEIPRGTVAGYYPELNPLIPISQHDQLSKTPASKGIAVRVAS